MTETERLAAIEAIRLLKARYWRGVDTQDDDLVRSVLAEDCVLDYMACCTDPVSGVDHMPQMNMVMKGRDSWNTGNLEGPRTVTVHTVHQGEIEVNEDETASGIWYFTDRFFFPAGGPLSWFTGYGRYYDTYAKEGPNWMLKTTRIERIRAEAG